jgi:PAS domain-containing protein
MNTRRQLLLGVAAVVLIAIVGLSYLARAAQPVPADLTTVNSILTQREDETAKIALIDRLVDGKHAGLQRTINIPNWEYARRSNSSREPKAAPQRALLVTIGSSLIFLFLFGSTLEPLAAADRKAKNKTPVLAYGAAAAAIAGATVLRVALIPLIGETVVPFITFFPAVLFASWYGGFRAGRLSILLSILAADYFFISAAGSLLIVNASDQVALLLFVLVAFGIALLSHSQRQAVSRAERESEERREAEKAEREHRQRLQTTLSSIGDAVLSTDAKGHIVFANPVAQSMLGLKPAEILGACPRNLQDRENG